jgi:hypothetical protein
LNNAQYQVGQISNAGYSDLPSRFTFYSILVSYQNQERMGGWEQRTTAWSAVMLGSGDFGIQVSLHKAAMEVQTNIQIEQNLHRT